MTSGGTADRWRRVEEVVGAALELEPARRAAFLDAACGGDEALRREVESLLAASDGTGALDRLAADVAPLTARLRGPDAPPDGTSDAAERAGRYRIGELVAGGGMGVVHRAVDEHLGRTVALKFLHARLHADDSAAERFRREARTVAALEHPNICTVHEIGESGDGRLFIAMPLYEGETLQQRIARGPLPVDEAVAIAVQVARALAKAHGAGIVHRDVKPSNVFLTADGIVKLLDFGIAKLVDATVTATGGTGPMGTVAYMSPEQARGDAVDHRSDLWSLGVVLYEMLTARRPFPGDAAPVVLELIVSGARVPLAERRADLPPALATIVDTALAKSPDARYQSAHALERDLRALDVAADVVRALPAGRRVATSAGRRWQSRWRPASRRLLGGAAAVSLVAAGALWLGRARGATPDHAAATPEPSIVVLPFVNMTADEANEALSDGLTEEVINRLATVSGLKVISRTSAMRYKGRPASVRQIAGELEVANVLEGSVRRSDGRLRVAVRLVDARSDRQAWAGSFDLERRDTFRVPEEVAGQVVRALEVTLREDGRRQLHRHGTTDPEAQELYRRGRFHWERRTPQDHAKAVAYFERAIARDSSYADAYAGLADAYLTAYHLAFSTLPEAEAYSRHKWAAERALALDDQSADAHTSFAISLWWQRNWPGAERELRRAIELDPGRVATHYWYALLLGGEDRLDEARRESQVASSLDPFALVSQQNYGWACMLQKDYACSIEQFRRAIELNGAWASSHDQLGLAYAYTGRYADAEREVTAALALDPRSGRFMADLSNVHARAGRTAEARRELRRALAHAAPPSTIARVYVALGQSDSAFAWLDRTDWTWPHRETLTDPGLAPLRADPRFARLRARVDHEMGIR